jgi:adenylate cyclase
VTVADPIPLASTGDLATSTDGSERTFRVEHDSELLGSITVKLSPSEPLTLVGERLITDLAAQAGLGVQFERVKERALFARALASFLPPQVAALIEKTPDALALREEVEATILFSDIRGFSTLAERLPAREVAEIAGRHLAAMAEVVSGHGGVLDKFAGDAVMAVFGAPNPLEDHAHCALRCAIAMQQRQAALNEQAEQDHLPVLQIGVGVNTGTVIAGTLGGTGRLDYTVLGDPVNVAQRLQSQASGGEIIASAATIRLAPTISAEPIGSKQLKGRQELVDAYRIPWETAVSDRPESVAIRDEAYPPDAPSGVSLPSR